MDRQEKKQQLVSVIIPAYNEAATIEPIIACALLHPQVGEVIVVSDGSTDQTVSLSTQAGAEVICLATNQGKAAAMDAGVLHATHDIICFLDADITGLTEQTISRIIDPVSTGTYDMFVAIKGRKSYWLNKFLRLSPIIGGERALSKKIWYQVPTQYKQSFQIEIALNYFTKKHGGKMGFTVVHSLNHIQKYKKRGFFIGWWQWLLMVLDLLKIGMRLYVGDRWFNT